MAARQRRCVLLRRAGSAVASGSAGRTAPQSRCSNARRGAIRAALWACRAVLETATRRRTDRGPRIERVRPERLEVRATVVTAEVCGVDDTHWDLHHCCRRCRGVAGHRAQPESAELRWWPRTRWPTCSHIPDSPPVGNDCGSLRRPCHWPGATNGGSGCRAHHSDRGRGWRVRRATREAPSPLGRRDQFAAVSAD